MAKRVELETTESMLPKFDMYIVWLHGHVMSLPYFASWILGADRVVGVTRSGLMEELTLARRFALDEEVSCRRYRPRAATRRRALGP